MSGRVLIIAGSDSGGGAGIQADIKTVTALGGFAMTAITALTAQNTLGVQAVFAVPPDFIRQQIEVVLQDLGADVIKIGMLGEATVIETVSEALCDLAPSLPIVLDPVMVAKGGQTLLADNAIATLAQRLLPMAFVITPNLPEAEVLTDQPIRGSILRGSHPLAAHTRHGLYNGLGDCRRDGAGPGVAPGGDPGSELCTSRYRRCA